MKIQYLLTAALGIGAALISLELKTSTSKKTPLLESSTIASKSFPGSFQVTLKAEDPLSLKSSDTITLIAEIFKPGDQSDFELQWILPNGISIIEGIVDPSLNFDQNGFAYAKIKLRIADTQKNYHITAEAYRITDDVEGTVHGALGHYLTNPQSLEKTEIEAVKEIKKHRIAH